MRDEHVAIMTGSVALALIAGALGFQYLEHLAPCEMCHWQRWPLIGAILVGLVGALVLKKDFRLLAIAAILLVAISGLIGAYQSGMQMGILPGPTACTAPRYIMGSHAEAVVQCNVVTWSLFGLSLASYNALISLGTAVLATLLLVKNRK